MMLCYNRGLNHAMRHDLHWLDMTDLVLFRTAVTVYRCLHGIAPDYLCDSCVHPASHSSSSRYCLRSVNRNQLAVPSVKLSVADDVLVYPTQPFGTACRIILETLLYSRRLSALSEDLVICTLLTFNDAIGH